jgi:hypothetical protein
MNKARLPSWLQAIAFHYPLSPTGSLLLVLAIALVGRGAANPYALALGALTLAVLTLLAAASTLQALRLPAHALHWDTSAGLQARQPDASHRVLAESLHTWPLLRVHFRLRGTLRVGRGAALLVRREIAFAASGEHALPMALPLAGLLDCRGAFHVGDLFALTRARFGEEQRRTLPVLPAGFSTRPLARIEPATGLEEQSRPRSSEEEKYFMREYVPGDRFRDINWKVTGRLAELVTRISPITQERTTILPVHFRNLRAGGGRPRQRDGLEAVAHLNVLKSWLLAFLRTVKQEHPQMQFRLVSAESTWLLQSAEDIERFAAELSGLFFQREVAGELLSAAESSGELFVFSTPYDRLLPAHLASQAGARVSLFRTRRAEQAPKSKPLALLQSGTGCLPGAWALRRDAAPASAGAAAPGGPLRLEEEPLEVRLL